MNHFKEIAQKFFDKEITVTPVISGKGPFVKEWNKLGDKILDKQHNSAWSKCTGLALVTGAASNIIALDIDIDNDCEDENKLRIRKQLEEMLPPIFSGRTGSIKRPPLRFYQHQLIDKIKFEAIGVEILSNGHACVLPPSVHPQGHNYLWAGKSLLDVDVDDLPMLPEEIINFLFQEDNKALLEKSKNNPRFKRKIRSDEQMLTHIKGRCKGGSYNYFSRVGVAMRYKQKTKEEIIERLFELDKQINCDSDYLLFECKTRRWPRSNSIRQNVELFVEEIIYNINPDDNNYQPDLDAGFFIDKELKDGRIVKVPDYNTLADYFSDILRYRFSDTNSLIYENGFYKPIFNDKVNSLIEHLTLRQCSPSHFNAFKVKIQAQCYTNFDRFNPPQNVINLNNGVLFLKTKELKPHDPIYAFKYKLKHNFNPTAKFPQFLKFLNQTFNDDQSLVNLIGEIMGYTLLGGDPVAHRAFAFFGEGRNGKSTLLDVILELLGKENVSAVSMKNIDKPFSTVSMDGKIANIVEESPAKIDAEAFKNIVSGGYVTAAHKGKPEYDLKINARLFFACNKLPVFRESTVAIKDRLVFVPFVNYIKKNQRDTNIKERLNKEIEGVLNFALDGLDRYLAHGFTESQASDQLMQEYQKESDSVFDWAFEKIKVTFDFSDQIFTDKAYRSYLDHCVTNRIKEVSRKSFDKRFANYLRQIMNENDNGFQLENIKRDRNTDGLRGYHCVTMH